MTGTADPAVTSPRPSTRLSNAMRIALAPSSTYSELAAVLGHVSSSWTRALSGAAGYGLVLGTAVSIAATNVASLTGMMSVALFWSFVPAVQLFTAWILCRHPPAANVGMARAIQLLFLSHASWSLWLLGLAASTFWFPPGPGLVQVFLLGVIVPVVWTPVMIAAFCRSVLGCTAREARWRTFVHQGTTWVVIAALSVLADQPWARFGGGA